MQIRTLSAAVLSVALGAAMIGCDDKMEEKKVDVKSDGTVVTEKKSVTEKADGTVVEETSKDIDRPDHDVDHDGPDAKLKVELGDKK